LHRAEKDVFSYTCSLCWALFGKESRSFYWFKSKTSCSNPKCCNQVL